jgi:hypothetical protein
LGIWGLQQAPTSRKYSALPEMAWLTFTSKSSPNNSFPLRPLLLSALILVL